MTAHCVSRCCFHPFIRAFPAGQAPDQAGIPVRPWAHLRNRDVLAAQDSGPEDLLHRLHDRRLRHTAGLHLLPDGRDGRRSAGQGAPRVQEGRRTDISFSLPFLVLPLPFSLSVPFHVLPLPFSTALNGAPFSIDDVLHDSHASEAPPSRSR